MFTQERISRLLNYKNLLLQLKAMGFVKVFSDNIADTLEVSSSLVRRDFASFHIKGNQKGGYVIDSIIAQINHILGKDEIQKVVIVGVGRIGEALINYTGFSTENIQIVAGFDIDMGKIDKNRPIPILPMSELNAFVQNNDIRIAVLAVPPMSGQQVVDQLKQAGIRGVLSFSTTNLKSPDMTVNNINIEHKLENLIFQVNHQMNSFTKVQ